MSVLTKARKELNAKYDFSRVYALSEGVQLLKDTARAKFDSSVDLAVRLGVDPQKADQMVRGVAHLPHGTGRVPRVLVVCTADKEAEALAAGADYVGADEYVKKIEEGWVDFDVIVTMPTLMVKLGRLGKVLGPRGLMPNPKTGTVTVDVAKAVLAIKQGAVNFKIDKSGIIHLSVGRVSFTSSQIQENILEVLNVIKKAKPSSAKGNYFRSLFISSTMGAGIGVDLSCLSSL